jgi:hypothetical protein
MPMRGLSRPYCGLPSARDFFKTDSFERIDLSPQEFGKLIRSDPAHRSALIKSVAVKID